MQKIISLLLFLMLAFRLFGQDIHFSQYFSCPVFINPACTGDNEGSWRFANLYRSQWKSISKPYSTLAVSFDKPMNKLNPSAGCGLIMLYDQSGIVGLSSVKLYASASYRWIFDKHYLRFGLQAGMVYKYFDLNLATFPSQYDITTGTYNPGLPSNESRLGETMTYFDANAGLLWKCKIWNLIPEFGVSCQHLNMPVESFSGEGEPLSVRAMAHGGIKIQTYRKFSLMPFGYYSFQAESNELLTGLLLDFGMVSGQLRTTSFSPGVFFRSGYNRNYDAIVIYTGITFVKMKIGFSYDITLSDLQMINKNRGAFELSLIFSNTDYLFDIKTLPCERY